MYRCHCGNIFQLCPSSWNREIASGALGTCSTKTVHSVEPCEVQVRRAGAFGPVGQDPARAGVGLSHRRSRLELSSGIYFLTIEGHRGDFDSNIKLIVFSGMRIPLTLNSLMTRYHGTTTCSPAAAAAMEARLTGL